MAQSGLIVTVAATGLGFGAGSISWRRTRADFKGTRRQSRRSAYVAPRCLHGSDPFAAIEIRLSAAEFESRRSADGDLKRQREELLEALQKPPLDLVQNLLLLRG